MGQDRQLMLGAMRVEAAGVWGVVSWPHHCWAIGLVTEATPGCSSLKLPRETVFWGWGTQIHCQFQWSHSSGQKGKGLKPGTP